MLTDFEGSQTNFSALFDNAQPQLEIRRPSFDITHTYNGNWLWELPFGEGRRWMDTGGILNAIAGGWDLSGFLRVRSGEPITIASGRATINRAGRTGNNTVFLTGIDIQELQERTGEFRDSEGGVNLFASSLRLPDGGANLDIFKNPGLLEVGTLGLTPVSGPWYATLDLGIRKSFPLPISEGSSLQLRADFFNSLNRTNFNVGGSYNPNSTQFGSISSAFSAREVQVGAKIIF